VRSDPRNRLPEGRGIPIFDLPVAAVAAASDPLFEQLRKEDVVGPIHASPEYWLAGARSVISYFLPFSKEIKQAYSINTRLPPLEWVSGRLNGEIFNHVLRRALVIMLRRQGGRVVAPGLDPRYKAVNWLPMWSERHVGFIAGLGSFGLHGGLLTEKGTAGRIGSVITDLVFPPSERAYTEVYAYCPWKQERRCGVCINRCPVGAISKEVKNHSICIANGAEFIRPAFKDWGYHGCGHCQCNLPCSDHLPGRNGPAVGAVKGRKQGNGA
jgi:epoxyqueuosine reductase QueG